LYVSPLFPSIEALGSVQLLTASATEGDTTSTFSKGFNVSIRGEADVHLSIREFASPETPIFMYDKDDRFVMKTLEEVCSFPVFDLRSGLLFRDPSLQDLGMNLDFLLLRDEGSVLWSLRAGFGIWGEIRELWADEGCSCCP